MVKAKGQITIYMAISFALIVSVFISCYEAARGCALQVYAETALEAGLCSAFGEYNRELLEEFDLLYIDMSYLSNMPDSDKLSSRINEYTAKTLALDEEEKFLFARDIFGVKDSVVSVTGYRLATDDFGASFRSQAVNYIKGMVSLGLADELQNWKSIRENYSLNQTSFEEKQSKAIEEINDGFENAKAKDKWKETEIKEDYVSVFMFSGVDILVFGTDAMYKGSKKTINLSDTLLFRNKNKGIGEFELDKTNIADEVIFDEYIMKEFGCYNNILDDRALDYETEYVIFGADSDASNLSFMVTELFFVRAAANVITIYSDKEKMDLIKTVAEGLSAICKYVPKEAWEVQIVCTWAAFEGVSDIKHLIKGERVPLIKKGDDMRVSLNGIIEGVEDEVFQAEGENNGDDNNFELGLTYRDYLRLFLLEVPSDIKTYRCMDLIENDLRRNSDNEFFRFDACTDAVSVIMTIKTVFLEELTGERKYYYY